jgi:hypothetical protein
LGDGVDEECIGHRNGHDIGEVESDEVGVAGNCAVADVADFDEDEEDDGQEEEEGREEGPDPASARCTFDLSWSGVGGIIGEGLVGSTVTVAVPDQLGRLLLATKHGGEACCLRLKMRDSCWSLEPGALGTGNGMRPESDEVEPERQSNRLKKGVGRLRNGMETSEQRVGCA